MTEILLISTGIIIFSIIIYYIFKKTVQQKIKQHIQQLADDAFEFSPPEFLTYKNSIDDFSGVYIIHNLTKNLYYIGQSKEILVRVSSHFSGRGNGDVYSDYKYGDQFTLKLINLSSSGYKSLDQLEKDAILTFDSFNTGYNKTRGNSGTNNRQQLFHPYNNSRNTSKYNRKQILDLVKKCADGTFEAPFDEYKEIRIGLFEYDIDMPGMYIIHNKTKNLFYIAKSNKHIFNAINKHFTGSGNNDIYADHQHGDEITIKTLVLKYSQYSTLDELVKETKKEYSKFAENYSKRKPH